MHIPFDGTYSDLHHAWVPIIQNPWKSEWPHLLSVQVLDLVLLVKIRGGNREYLKPDILTLFEIFLFLYLEQLQVCLVARLRPRFHIVHAEWHSVDPCLQCESH